MKKKKLTDAILEEAARMVVEEDFREQKEKAMQSPHIPSPEFQTKMNRLFAPANGFAVHNQSDAAARDKPFLKQLDNKRKKHLSPGRTADISRPSLCSCWEYPAQHWPVTKPGKGWFSFAFDFSPIM